ncbi:TetR/AcrR family transcriptional regulator [Quadrisphaera sp. KR29]|uniref:TetR/AcrR family transcriptional regulator n=1 Tax=Quadrisphaera sp. KR29 TaxID=3461391 RepID=UPI0040441F5E
MWSADELARRAVRVLDQRGYADCTMSELADALDVSVRTLHRYFPSKSDIVWKSVPGTLQRSAERLVHTDSQVPAFDVVRANVRETLQESGQDWEALRCALGLIAACPELQRFDLMGRGQEVIARYLRTRLAGPRAHFAAAVLSAAINSVTMATLLWWAQHEPAAPDPRELVDEALSLLAQGYGHLLA